MGEGRVQWSVKNGGENRDERMARDTKDVARDDKKIQSELHVHDLKGDTCIHRLSLSLSLLVSGERAK